MSVSNGGVQTNIPLPPDFVAFMRRNYEIIEDIERKVKQFQIPLDDLTPYHRLRQAQFKKIFDSVDSCFSDSDVRKVISAHVKPKVGAVNAREDRIQIDLFDNWSSNDQQFDPDLEDYTYISKRFPLISLSYESSGKNYENFLNSAPLIVNGIPLTFSERLAYQKQHGRQSHNSYKKKSINSGSGINARNRQNLDFSTPENKSYSTSISGRNSIHVHCCRCQHHDCKKDATGIIRNKNTDHTTVSIKKEMRESCSVRKDAEQSFGNYFSKVPHQLNTNNDDGNGLNGKTKTNNQFLSLPNKSQLTLPPLHSSVLTLLGQRGGLKPSPRGLLGQIHEQSTTSGANRQKVK